MALSDGFFKNWIWEEGDQFLFKRRDGEHIIHSIGDSYLVDGDVGSWYAIGVYETEFPIIRDIIRPVPNQRQLQNKILDFYKENGLDTTPKWNELWMLDQFCKWLLNVEFDMKQDWDFECMWLAYAEELIYGKKWDGENWI